MEVPSFFEKLLPMNQDTQPQHEVVFSCHTYIYKIIDTVPCILDT